MAPHYTSAKDLNMSFPPHIFMELFGQICDADVATEFMETNKQWLAERISESFNVGLMS